MNSFYPSFSNGIDNQQEKWIPFEFQDCNSSTLVLYANEEGDNQDFVVNVEVTNLSNMKLGISSSRKTGEISFVTEYFPILEIGINSITFSSVNFCLKLDTALNRTIKHNIAVSGQYQINEGEWQAFELQNCYPKSVTILEDHEFEYNLTIDLNIIEIIGELEIYFGYSDVGDTIDLFEEGEYSYNLTAHYISLNINIYYLDLPEDYGKATGWYKVTTYERSPIVDMIGFELLFLISMCGLWYVSKRK